MELKYSYPMKSQTTHSINWSQIYALAGLNAAVVISWIAYHNYQPKVLEKFQFTELTNFLTIAQAIVLVLIPPIAGYIGDIVIRRGGSHFLVFTIGAGVTAMTFMAVAFSATGVVPQLRSVLPIMIVIWLIAMNIFHSPANSLLEMFAPARELPLVMSAIALTTELLYGIEPIVVLIIDYIGAVLTFVTGGVLLIVTGYFFRKTTANMSFERSAESLSREDNFLFVILAGLGFGLIDSLITHGTTLFSWFGNRFSVLSTSPDINNYVICGILITAAFATIPASKIINTDNIAKILFVALVACLVLCGLLYAVTHVWLSLFLCFILGIMFSVVAVTAFPYAISYISVRNITLGTGLFYGSFKVVDAFLSIFLL
jgi:MFS family permease